MPRRTGGPFEGATAATGGYSSRERVGVGFVRGGFVPMRLVPMLSCLAFGCAAPDVEGACKDFVAAANACNQEHADVNGIEPTLLQTSLCETDTSDASHDELEAAVDRYECKADAYATPYCERDDGYKNAIAADAACD